MLWFKYTGIKILKRTGYLGERFSFNPENINPSNRGNGFSCNPASTGEGFIVSLANMGEGLRFNRK